MSWQWNLVCINKGRKSHVQGSIAVGKLIGGFIFGFLADKWVPNTNYLTESVTFPHSLFICYLYYHKPQVYTMHIYRIKLGKNVLFKIK